MSKTHFITISDTTNHHVERLLTSCKAHDIPIRVVGENYKYSCHGTKIEIIDDVLRDLPDEDIVVYVDAFDVIFFAGEDEILSKFKKWGRKVVFGGEQAFAMDDKPLKWFFKMPNRHERFCFLNAGTFMGYVKDLKDLLKAINIPYNASCDQTYFIKHFASNPESLAIDYQQEIFACNGGRGGLEERDYEFRETRIYSKINNNMPCIFHSPGRLFIPLDKLAVRYGFMAAYPEYSAFDYKTAKIQLDLSRKVAFFNVHNFKYLLFERAILYFILPLLLLGLGGYFLT